MNRRIFSSVLLLSVLLLASLIFSHHNVMALTPTVSATPTPGTADFVGTPLSGTAPLTVQFTDVSNISITACTWNYGDGIGLTVDPTGTPFTACPSLPHTYTSAGSFTVTMHLFKADGTGVTVTKTNYVQVANPPLTPTRTFTPTPTIAGDLGYGTVSGKVTDAGTGAAIAGAIVTCSHAAYNPTAPCSGTRTTAADGTYSFTNVFFHDTDQITVSVSAAGHVSQIIVKTPFTTAGMTANFALIPTVTATITPIADLIVTGSVHTLVSDMVVPVAGAQVKAAIGVGRVITTTTAADGSYSMLLPAAYIVGYGAGFTVSATGYVTYTASYTEPVLRANPVVYFTLVAAGQPTATATVTPTITRTPSRTPTGPTPTITRTPTRTNTPVVTNTPTRTPTPTTGTGCSPVTSSITAPFTFDGAGTFCWQSTSLGGYVNSWNVTSLTINGVNVANLYLASASYPAKINGYWYVSYNSSVAWGHFEAK